jgi:2-hydroxychromene-2-carboxylate isomerase
MSVSVQYVFDFGSPNAYLAHRVVPEIQSRTGVVFEYLPALLGGILKATNNVSPVVSLQGIKNKGEYTRLEMQRFIAKHGISEFRSNPHFPVNTLQIMRGAIVAQNEGFLEKYVDEVFRHMWVEPKKMDDPEVLRSAFEESGLPADTIMEQIQDAAVKQQLIDNTAEVVGRGVFGIPSFFVGDELFFGKDRTSDVEEEIRRQSASG